MEQVPIGVGVGVNAAVGIGVSVGNLVAKSAVGAVSIVSGVIAVIGTDVKAAGTGIGLEEVSILAATFLASGDDGSGAVFCLMLSWQPN